MRMRIARYWLFLGLAACGSAASTSNQMSSTGQANSASEPSSAASADPAPQSGRPFIATPVATFDSPWAMAFLPGSNLGIVTEKPGRLWLVDIKSGVKQPVSGAPRVVFSDQGGLLDVALSPTFASDNLVYLTYAEPSHGGGSGLALARARLVRNSSGGSLQGLTILWHDPQGGQGGQFGAIIAFAPDGKSLFLSSGERQRFTPAQDPNQPLGKILHLTLDGKPASDNPWSGHEGSSSVKITDPPDDTQAALHAPARTMQWPGPNFTPAETWTLGHRNPYGLTFDSKGRLWETEMGPRGGDELNLIIKGKNYGWPLVSEGENYDGNPIAKPSTRPDLEAAKLFWVPSVSPTTLLIYSGKLFPQWSGNGFIGSLSGKSLIRVAFDGDSAKKLNRWDMGARIRWVGEGPTDGAIYLLEDQDGARLLRLTPSGTRR